MLTHFIAMRIPAPGSSSGHGRSERKIFFVMEPENGLTIRATQEIFHGSGPVDADVEKKEPFCVGVAAVAIGRT